MKYSIIVPTYNSSKYLKSCLNTLVTQISKDTEIIFIDDNSNDNTVNIIESCCNNVQNITLLKNDKNYGPSYSRNRGLDIAKGEYILFVDSDDVLYPHLLKHALKYCSNNYDFILFPDTRSINSLGESSEENIISRSRLLMNYNAINFSLGVEMDGPWSKIYSNKIIKSSGLRFNNKIRIGEDILFNFQYCLMSNKCLKGDVVAYYYRDDEYQINNKPYKNIDIELIKFFVSYFSLLSNNNLSKDYYDRFYYNILNGYIYIYFIRDLFNSVFHYTKKEQKAKLIKFIQNHYVKKALFSSKIRWFKNKKKKILIILFRTKMYKIAIFILNKKYSK